MHKIYLVNTYEDTAGAQHILNNDGEFDNSMDSVSYSKHEYETEAELKAFKDGVIAVEWDHYLFLYEDDVKKIKEAQS